MYVAVDIGGSKTTIATFSQPDPAKKLSSATYATPKKYAAALDQLQPAITAIVKDQPLTQIGISLALKLSSSGIPVLKANLPDYLGHDFKTDLAAHFSVPIFIKNDAVCAATAEMTYGLGRDKTSLLHLIIGTGLGGAYLRRDEAGFYDVPLEPEWTIIHPGGMSHTHYQIKGLTAAYVSSLQLEAQLNQPLSTVPDDHRIWDQVTHYLTMAIYNLIVFLAPEVVSCSGGLIENRPFLIDRVSQSLTQYQELVTPPPLALSQVKDNPCLVGAFLLGPKTARQS